MRHRVKTSSDEKRKRIEDTLALGVSLLWFLRNKGGGWVVLCPVRVCMAFVNGATGQKGCNLNGGSNREITLTRVVVLDEGQDEGSMMVVGIREQVTGNMCGIIQTAAREKQETGE